VERSTSDLKQVLRSARPITAAELLFNERLRQSLREALSDVEKQPPTPEQAELAERLEQALRRASRKP
jgi:predicted nucleic acid-binding protein